ncbi:hypothetical protein RR42_s2105 [Cupriavidus basilensis]|uniref:Uncharacterized protein n=1 Tax=Cupriavidus basilensis TaxID=68895 RepID=A0A0C4YDH4_9BURK|nr:hypothetical protein RR42_s2105 [Cupriavidus basilensis]
MNFCDCLRSRALGATRGRSALSELVPLPRRLSGLIFAYDKDVLCRSGPQA